MMSGARGTLKVGTQIRVPAATAQLVQFHFTDPVDSVMRQRDSYWLDLCLQPRPKNARACFLNHWASQRFKKLGPVYLLPPGERIHARTDGNRSHSSVLCHFQPQVL